MLWHAIGFLLVMVLALTELFLAWTWGDYMRFGIPLFRRSTGYRVKPKTPLVAKRLSGEFGGLLAPRILFLASGPDEIAFREKMFSLSLLSYSPVMRGFIRFDDRSGTLTVTGHAYLYPFGLMALVAAVALTEPVVKDIAVEIVCTFFLLLGVVYAVQAYRFNGVFKALRDGLGTRDRP